MAVHILENLQTIEMLCRKYGYQDRAEDVAVQSSLFQKDRELFWTQLVSLEWWGGSGSMAETELYVENGTITDNESKEDNRTFRTALISIYEEMIHTGHDYPQAKSWTDIFRMWQSKGI